LFPAREAHHASVRNPLSRLSLFFTYLFCLSYHSNRDIKPDNILLDERGHAHLTDFNIAVHYSDRRLLTGVAGSMAYMAPEILHKRGYTYPIDWWSLGVCAYELMFGRRPFRGRTNTALTLSISKDALRFPENAESKCGSAGLSFIRGVSSPLWPVPHLAQVLFLPQLLDRDPHKRLACSPQGDSLDEIQQHAWLNSIDWTALNRKELPSPFVPDVGYSVHGRLMPFLLTTSSSIQSKKANFDASHELEELLLEDNPLKAKARKQNRDINSLSSEMRQMEEQCVGSRANILELCSYRVRYRFKIYDFRAMHRRSYYPHNQQIVSTVTATSSLGVIASRPVTPGEVGNGLDIQLPDESKGHDHHHLQDHDINEKDIS